MVRRTSKIIVAQSVMFVSTFQKQLLPQTCIFVILFLFFLLLNSYKITPEAQ